VESLTVKCHHNVKLINDAQSRIAVLVSTSEMACFPHQVINRMSHQYMIAIAGCYLCKK